MSGKIVGYIIASEDSVEKFDTEFRLDGFCKILIDNNVETNNKYVYLKLWTPVTYFETNTSIDLEATDSYLYGTHWLFYNDPSHDVECKKLCKVVKYKYTNHVALRKKIKTNVDATNLQCDNESDSYDNITLAENLKLYDVAMKYYYSNDGANVMKKECIEQAKVGRESFCNEHHCR